MASELPSRPSFRGRPPSCTASYYKFKPWPYFGAHLSLLSWLQATANHGSWYVGTGMMTPVLSSLRNTYGTARRNRVHRGLFATPFLPSSSVFVFSTRSHSLLTYSLLTFSFLERTNPSINVYRPRSSMVVLACNIFPVGSHRRTCRCRSPPRRYKGK